MPLQALLTPPMVIALMRSNTSGWPVVTWTRYQAFQIPNPMQSKHVVEKHWTTHQHSNTRCSRLFSYKTRQESRTDSEGRRGEIATQLDMLHLQSAAFVYGEIHQSVRDALLVRDLIPIRNATTTVGGRVFTSTFKNKHCLNTGGIYLGLPS